MYIKIPFRFILFVSFFLIYFFSNTPSFSSSSDEPFIGPSNWGGTGLMEIPTARVMKENTFRFGFSQIDPYRHFYGAISPIKGLEIDFRVTEILGTEITAPGWEGYGNTKGKTIDLKYQIIPEGKYLPAIGIGIMDPHGTRNYASQYLVASKPIYPFDFTLGFGNGRFGKKPLPSQGEGFKIEMFSDFRGWLRDSQFFWGIQFVSSDKYALMLEYNPIQYHKQTNDPAHDKYFKEPVSSKYNIGLRYNLWDWAKVDLTYQRGDTVGINISMPFEIGKPLRPIYDQPYKELLGYKLLSPEFRLVSALSFSGFNDIGVEIIDDRMIIDLQNSKYFYTTRALEVILTTIAPIISGYDLEDVTIIFKESSIPLFSVHITKNSLLDYVKYKFTPYESYVQPEFDTDYIEIPDNPKRPVSGLLIGFKPQFNFFLNDPSGFLKGNLGVSLWVSYRPWAGGSLIAGVASYPFTSISTVNEPLSIPVRTDIVDYLENKVLFERFLLNQLYRIPKSNIFASFSAGILETQYAGFDAEVASSFLGGRLFMGLSGSVVKKRDPDNPIKLKEDDVKNSYTTAFLNARLNFPKPDVAVDIKYGRFLAGDVGTKITISKFIKAVKLSAWYSFTDTSIFNDPFNRDYHDKGISVMIPVRIFKGTDSRSVYGHSISPWTRDVAQDIAHFKSLFDIIGRNVEIFFKKDVGAR